MQVTIARYPQLRRLCWSRPGAAVLEGAEALALYEAGWRHVDEAALTEDERALVGELAARHGGGVLLARGLPMTSTAPPHGAHGVGDRHDPARGRGRARGRTSGAARRHDRHAHVLAVLRALDADLVERAGCALSGDAAAVLALDGYRAVGGIVLSCASQDGLRLLRARLLSEGARALFRDGATGVGAAVRPLREPRADPWGLRLAVTVGGRPVAVEVEQGLPLALAGEPDPALAALDLPVAVPGRAELFRDRLLTNADRHADPASLGRDAIDLAVMVGRWGPIPEDAWAGARTACGGEVVDTAYARALAGLRDPARLARCLDGLGIDRGLAPVVLALSEAPPDALPEAQGPSGGPPHEGDARA